jgi:hypothetical protein
LLAQLKGRKKDNLFHRVNTSNQHGSVAITEPVFTAFASAIGAAKHSRTAFDAVANDPTTAVIALRRHDVNGTLEAVEDVRFAVAFNFDRLVVVVSAMFAFSHKDLLRLMFHRLTPSSFSSVTGSLDFPACSCFDDVARFIVNANHDP